VNTTKTHTAPVMTTSILSYYWPFHYIAYSLNKAK